MIKTHVIVKTHEIALKGKNRPWFLRRLEQNLRRATQDLPVERVWQGQLLFGLTLADAAAWPEVKERVRDCFGVAKLFLAYGVEPTLKAVEKALPGLLEKQRFESFRITANRADKRFPKRSFEINQILGSFVQKLTGARVDLKNPGLEIFLDVHHREILIYFEEVPGYGGLPVGVSGRALCLMSGGLDSPVAAWHMMKRGCAVDLLHFHSYPLVDRSSMDKAEELAQRLARYQLQISLFLAPLADIQKRVIVNCPSDYRVLLYRRFMFRIAEAVARREGCQALITGESLGQVASQTLDNLAVVDEVAQLPVFRPVIGANKEEIMQTARRIETFSISTQPDQDCCSLFVPRHPTTAADPETIRRLEERLEVAELVEQAVEATRRRDYSFPDAARD